MSDRSGPGFIDPTPGLLRDFEDALERLRGQMGEPRTFSDRRRFWRARLRLHREMVSHPLRSAKW